VHDSAKPIQVSQSNNEQKLFLKVKTIIQTHCNVSCHAPSLGFYDGLPVVLETDSDIVNQASGIKSSVADSVTLTNKRMPLGGTLSVEDLEIIKNWFSKGGTLDN
jgi:uncharacterized membrane protein